MCKTGYKFACILLILLCGILGIICSYRVQLQITKTTNINQCPGVTTKKFAGRWALVQLTICIVHCKFALSLCICSRLLDSFFYRSLSLSKHYLKQLVLSCETFPDCHDMQDHCNLQAMLRKSARSLTSYVSPRLQQFWENNTAKMLQSPLEQPKYPKLCGHTICHRKGNRRNHFLRGTRRKRPYEGRGSTNRYTTPC